MSFAVLKKVSLFSGLKDKELKEILKSTSSKKYYKNNIIILEAEGAGDLFFMIKKGKVKVTREDQDGKEIVLTVLSAGDYFGEISLIDGLSRSANVISLSETEVLTLNHKDFLNLINKNTTISFNLLKVLCARVRNLDAIVKRLSLMNAIGKVSTTLLRLAEPARKKKENAIEIEKFPSLQDIAKMSGTSRSLVSKSLNNLENSGIIKRENKKVIITDYTEFKSIYC